MLAILNGELVMPDHLIPEGYLLLKEGKIEGYGPMTKLPALDGYDILDAKGDFVAPGFVDIHKHASSVFHFAKQPLEAAKHALSQGTTTVLPTLSYSLTREELLQGIDLQQF